MTKANRAVLARNAANAAFVLAEVIQDIRAAVPKSDREALRHLTAANLPRPEDIHDLGQRAVLLAERWEGA